jgi:hypothetical protein
LGKNKTGAKARVARPTYVALVSNLQIGNPEVEVLASLDGKLEPFDKAQDMLYLLQITLVAGLSILLIRENDNL